MPTYVIVNRQPDGYRGSPDAVEVWNRWFVALGDQLVDRGNPAFTRSAVGDCGPDTTLGGYTPVTADDLASAVRLARSCPAVADGGGAEVGELTALNPPAGPAAALHRSASAG